MRAALSFASWLAFSLGTNLPLGAAFGVRLDVVVAAPAAFPFAEPIRTPPRAPPTVDPASTSVRIHFFPMVISHLLSFAVTIVGRSKKAVRGS